MSTGVQDFLPKGGYGHLKRTGSGKRIPACSLMSTCQKNNELRTACFFISLRLSPLGTEQPFIPIRWQQAALQPTTWLSEGLCPRCHAWLVEKTALTGRPYDGMGKTYCITCDLYWALFSSEYGVRIRAARCTRNTITGGPLILEQHLTVSIDVSQTPPPFPGDQ